MTVNWASAPSVTSPPEVTLTSEVASGASSLSSTETVSVDKDPTVYPSPSFSDSVTEPSGSSASSSVVAMVSVALPAAGIVTVCDPVLTPKSPLAATVTSTARSDVGAGAAVRVNVTFSPSLPPRDAVMFTSGAGGGSSLSATPTEAVPCVADAV